MLTMEQKAALVLFNVEIKFFPSMNAYMFRARWRSWSRQYATYEEAARAALAEAAHEYN